MFEEEIKKLNPGRKIEVNKICPHLKDICIQYKCNAYSEHFETNIVKLEDKIRFENSDIDWEYELIKDGWIFKSGSTSCCGPENQDSLYVKKSEISNLGRCLI